LWQRQTILYKTQTKFWCEQDIFIPPKLGKGQTAWRKLLTSSRCVPLESWKNFMIILNMHKHISIYPSLLIKCQW
jgi:hypothetical protein